MHAYVDIFDMPDIVNRIATGRLGLDCLPGGGDTLGVLDAWGELEDHWDRHDPYGEAVATLYLVADVLRGFESPDWGNVGGRYEVSFGAGGLTSADWEALERGAYYDECGDTSDHANAWGVQAIFTYLMADPAHLPNVVHLGDLMAQVMDECRTLGLDY